LQVWPARRYPVPFSGVKRKMKFPASIYSRYRPFYPEELFILMADWLRENSLPDRGLTVADLGCGTGHSTHGLAHSGLAAKVIAVDPDPEMLAEASEKLQASPVAYELRAASGENTGLADRSVDAVFSASAFHWMKRDPAVREFLRIVKKPGLILLAEYSFPKSQNHPDFDSWIRSQLTGPWQIPELAVRKSFADMVGIFGEQPGVRSLGNRHVPMNAVLAWQEMAGLIQSQSRYVRARQSLASEELRENLDRQVESKVHELLGGDSDHYDFGLQASGFLLS
jgi:SAM-dependent methyltransferase